MGLLQISFRNFLRQKRRNILLGIAIAFGVMVLTVANAFSQGISDNLLNRVVIYMTGHIRVNVMENGRYMTPIVRNPALIETVKDSVSGLVKVQDDVGVYARAIGNGKSDYVFMVGIQIDPEFKGQFNVVSGSFAEFESGKTANPVMLSETKAKALNVKTGDTIGLRLLNVNGQNETAVLTVAGILKSQNVFMDYAVFTPLPRLKAMMGYQPWESGAIKVILKNPKSAKEQADQVQQALAPPPAFWTGDVVAGTAAIKGVSVLPLVHKPQANVLKKSIALPENWVPTNGVIVSEILAQKLNVSAGDTLTLSYSQAFRPEIASVSTIISAVAAYSSDVPDTAILMNDEDFFTQFNHFYPKTDKNGANNDIISEKSLIYSQIGKQWHLTERSKKPKSMMAEMKELMKFKQNQPLTSVSSMYEAAGEIVKIEQVFNMATFIAGAILFAVIMIGVLNSLRMTIRERTQEIGTLRAIGMKAREVQWMFLLEAFFLAMAGWIAGLVVSAVVIGGLSMIQFGADNPFNMMMVDRHLYFVPTAMDTFKNWALLMVFSLITAYFPARSAAKLPPAEAFRHIN